MARKHDRVWEGGKTYQSFALDGIIGPGGEAVVGVVVIHCNKQTGGVSGRGRQGGAGGETETDRESKGMETVQGR